MGKHSRKRQRLTTDNDDLKLGPIGSTTALGDDDSKDEEEKRLEALLFGTKFPSSGAVQPGSLFHQDEIKETEHNAGGGLEHLLDSDLFYFDDAGPSAISESLVTPLDREDNEPNYEEVADADSASATHSSPEDKEDHSSRLNNDATRPPPILKSDRKKSAAWADPDDQNLQISLASKKRLRKLRDAPVEDTIGGKDYEVRLRRQYEKVHPVPEWASVARKQLQKKKRRRSSQSSESEGGTSDTREGMTALLSSSGGLLSSRQRNTLPQGQLSIERLRDANQSAKTEGDIRSVMFHPSPSVPILLTAGADRRLRLFNIDGHTNPHLQSVHVPSLPITTALFHPTGSSILLTGHRPFFYTYDLQSGNCARSPRGLWGTHAANPDSADLSMATSAFSHAGDFLAVAGRRGYVHLVDWRRGSGQVVGSVKMNAAVKDVWWTEEGKLMSLGDDAEVYLWDVGERRCVRRWKDDGGFGSVTMTGARRNAYLAIGSKTGLVNLYGSDSTIPSTSGAPKPLKTIGNLTTSISTMRFNHDAQILALASNNKKDQLKMVHLPSLTVFSNWPTSTTPLGHITSMDFSASSEYAAIGNNRGRVLLYSLRHFVSV